MNKEDKMRLAIGEIDEQLVEGAREANGRKGTNRSWVKLGIAAAAVLLIAVIGVFAVSGLFKAGVPESSVDTSKAKNRETAASPQWAGWTIDQYIENSSCIFIGKCTEIKSKENGSAKLRFDIQTVLKGTYDPDVRDFVTAYSYPFAKQKDYLIFCGRDASVYSGEDTYGISAVLYDTQDGLAHEGVFDLELENVSSVCGYIADYLEKHPSDGAVPVRNDYCRSEDLREIFDFASTVMVARITGVLDDSMEGRTSYSFEVKNVLKGSVNNEEWVLAFKQSMTVGEEYLLLLAKPDEQSVFFTMCSPKSILQADSEDAQAVLSLAE